MNEGKDVHLQMTMRKERIVAGLINDQEKISYGNKLIVIMIQWNGNRIVSFLFDSSIRFVK